LQTRDRNSGTAREAFRFGEAGEAPSSFDLQFIANNKLYRFGVKVDDRRIVEEWLARNDWFCGPPTVARARSFSNDPIPGASMVTFPLLSVMRSIVPACRNS
jgi:hypothetical protein